jgi:hypothetical protein
MIAAQTSPTHSFILANSGPKPNLTRGHKRARTPAAKLRRRLRESAARKAGYARNAQPEHVMAIQSQLPLIPNAEVLLNLRACELFLRANQRRAIDVAWAVAELNSDPSVIFRECKFRPPDLHEVRMIRF